MAHTIDVAFQFFVCINGHIVDEIIIAVRTCQHVVASIFGIFTLLKQVVQRTALESLGLSIVLLELILPWFEQLACKFCQTHILRNVSI